MAEGDTFALMELASNVIYLRSMGGLNGIRVRCGGNDENGYIDHPHKKLICPFIFIILLLSIKSVVESQI